MLADYRSAGFEFIYSAELVRKRSRLRSESRAPDPIARLRNSLEQEGLTLRAGHADNVYRIVKRRDRRLAVRGRVSDAATDQPLSGAHIEIGDLAANTDDSGRFLLFPAETGPLSVSMPDYETVTVPKGKRLGVFVEVALKPLDAADEVVLVVDRGEAAAAEGDSTNHQLASRLELTSPTLDDDPVRAANRLISVRTNGLSAVPHVRGGLRDETVVLFNGVRLLEPFHFRDFQSIFSGLAPEAIQQVDVYTGGFSARYGNSLSGVVDIEPVDPTKGDRAELAWSFLNASATARGTMAGNRGAWAGSARRGNLDLVTRYVNPKVGTPSYADAHGLLSWEFGANSQLELELGTIQYNDDIEVRKGSELAQSRYRNQYWWARLERHWTSNWTTTTSVSTGAIRHVRDGFLGTDAQTDHGYGTVDDQRRFDVWTVAQRATYRSGHLFAEFGLGCERQRGRYIYQAEGKRGPIAALFGVPETIDLDIRVRPHLRRSDGYMSIQYRPRSSVALRAGVRWDRQDYGEYGDSAEQFNPRLSVLFDLGSNTTLRLATGAFSQSEGVHQLPIGDGITGFQHPQRARHVLAGLRHTLGNTGFDIHVEAFHKRYWRTKRRFENLFNPMVLLPELASDRVAMWPSRAYTDGYEITIRYEGNEHLNGWLAYTHSAAKDWIDGRWTPRQWEQSDSVSAGVVWKRGSWSASAALLWHSGWRTTPLAPLLGENVDPITFVNSDRFPAFASVDVHVERSWKWGRQSLTAFLHVVNALNRENLGGIAYTLEPNAAGTDLAVRAKPKPMIPLAPLLGVRWQVR